MAYRDPEAGKQRRKELRQQKWAENPELMRAREAQYSKNYRATEAGKIKNRESFRRYYEKNRDEVRAKQSQKYATDPEWRAHLAEYNKQYRAENPEKCQQMPEEAHAYYMANREEILAKQKARKQTNPEAEAERARHWYDKNLAHYLWHSAKARAKKYGIEFTIKKSDIVVPEYCPVFPHIKLTRGRGQKSPTSATLDRLDPRGGYTPKNVWVICDMANTFKSYASPEELRQVAGAVEAELKRRATL